MQLRSASYQDLPRILEIERLCFPQPWSLNSFRRELSLPFSRIVVAEDGRRGVGGLSGFMCRWLVADESHILNVAVHPTMRREGIGTELISDAVSEALAKQATLVTLEVRHSNIAARALYRKFGFQERRLRRNYYGPGQDAIVMELRLLETAE